MTRPFSRIPLWLRRVLLPLAALAVLTGLPGTAQAAVKPASPAVLAARPLVVPAHALVAGATGASGHAAGPAQRARPAQRALPVNPGRAGAPGGVCQVPGVGDIGGLLGFCAAGSSGLIGDINNICQPSVPAPEPATGGIDALIKPPADAVRQPATLYDSYGVAGQSWNAYDLQCSDMTSLIGGNIAGVVFDAAKALDRVTITVYQSAASEGILAWLSNAVDRLITSLGNAVYFPYLAPVIIIGAIWLAWQGLIRKRATRTIEGTVWMVLACAAAIWLIGRPGDFTGIGRTVSDGITQTLNIAFSKLPVPQQSSCVPLQKGDPQTPAGANFAFTSGNGVVDSNANELWTVLVCKPWLDGEFGTTTFAAKTGQPTVVNRYGRQLLWAQAIAANEKATTSVITAKQDAFAGIAAAIKQNDAAVYPLFQGKQWTTRLEIAFAALFAALIAGVLVLLIAITLIILKLGFLLLLVAGPFFLIVGTHPGFGRVIALRWVEMLIGVLLKQAAIALVLSVLLYAYSLIMGASDAALPWALKILMISLVTVAVFIYRKPFGHLFSAVGYGVIGSRDQADASLAKAGSTAGRNTIDAATVGVPGFAAYRAARWARRNPAQAASIAAQVATGGATGVMAGAAAAASDGSAGTGARAAGGGTPQDRSSASPGPADAPYQGSGTRAGGRDRVRGAVPEGNGTAGNGRTPPPLELPSRQADTGASAPSGWSRNGAGTSRPRWPEAAPGPAPRQAPPRPSPGSGPPAVRGAGGSFARMSPPAAGRGSAGPAAGRGSAGPAAGAGSAGHGNAGGEERPAARDGADGQPGPFWLRPVRRRK
jgi:hypothetical protein